MRLRRVTPLLVLLLAVGVPASADEGAAGDAVVEVLGNPTAPATVAAPTGPVPVPLDRPRGTTPATHVYVDSVGGAPSAYLTAQLRLPAGQSTAALDLVLVDDPGDRQDVGADTALLQACLVLGPLDEAAPDDPAELDCSNPVSGARAAGADGAGTWIFGLQALADRARPDGTLGVAVTTVPGAGAAASVAFLRDSVRFPYVLQPPETAEPVSGPLPAPAPLASDLGFSSASSSEIPQALAPLTGPVVDAQVLGPIAEPSTQVALLPAPQVAPPAILEIRPQAALTGPASPLGGPRPLLLLLVPLVPLLVLRTAGALGPEPEREPGDGTDDPYPGLRRPAG